MVRFRQRLGFTIWDLAAGSVIGAVSGAASAAFLWMLERAIALRVRHLWLLALLPALGLVSAWLYRRFGKEAEGGGSLILDEILEFKGRVPARMAPLVLVGTLLTHLSGGSAGREGTAVQMGASLARTVGELPWRWLGLTPYRKRLLLMAGVSAGFGSLFGTPVAGALFGMEVIAIGKFHYEGLLMCTAASAAGDGICRLLGAHHGRYAVQSLPLGWGLGLKLLLFALPVAFVAGSFSEASHGLARWTKERFERQWMLRPVIGGLALGALFLLFRDEGHLNLGLPWLERIFQEGAAIAPWAFAVKFLFTCVTVGFGFKGGEVTPLFVIGALLGAALAPLFGLPPAFLAVIGFVAVFAAASNTPLASTVMGVELFGSGFIAPFTLTCFLAYVLVGHRGIYGGHRVHTPKHGSHPG